MSEELDELRTARTALWRSLPVISWADSMIVGDGECGICGNEYAWVQGHMEECDADDLLEASSAHRDAAGLPTGAWVPGMDCRHKWTDVHGLCMDCRETISARIAVEAVSAREALREWKMRRER